MTISCSYDELQVMAKNLIEALPSASFEQAEAGFKCFTIAWFNCTFPKTYFGQMQEKIEHPILYTMISRMYDDQMSKMKFT